MAPVELQTGSAREVDAHDGVRLTPWRQLPPAWIAARARLAGTPIPEGEPAALELLVITGALDGASAAPRSFLAPDLVSTNRVRRLVAQVAGQVTTVRSELAGGAHPYVSYEVIPEDPLSGWATYALQKERRRLDAGDRWLSSAFEAGALAAALWRGTVLRSPPLLDATRGTAVWRVGTRTEAAALAAAATELSVAFRVERKFRLWRVHVPAGLASRLAG